MIQRFLRNYLLRHQNRSNQILHLIGVPLALGGFIGFGMAGEWLIAGIALISGYALQFWGHFIEQNDAGELILIKKMLGKPYTEFGPGTQKSSNFD
ncbi:MAG: Mpo1-like protein [Planctomycetota bacterium]